VHDRAKRCDVAERREPVHEAGGLVAAPRRHLGGAEAARRRVEQEQVGERASDIDADNRPAHTASPRVT